MVLPGFLIRILFVFDGGKVNMSRRTHDFLDRAGQESPFESVDIVLNVRPCLLQHTRRGEGEEKCFQYSRLSICRLAANGRTAGNGLGHDRQYRPCFLGSVVDSSVEIHVS